MNDLLRSSKGRVGALAAVGLIGIAAMWFLLVSPQKSKAAKLDAKVASSQAELRQKRLELARPSAAVKVSASDLYRLTKALPNDAGLSGILLDVNRLAGSNGLDFRSITPSQPQAGVGYLQQPLAVVVEGRFGDVSRFLGDLRMLVTVRHGRLDARGRLYAVTQVDLAEAKAKKFPIVQATVTLNAYSFSKPAPATQTSPDSSTTDPSSSGSVAAGANP